MFGFIKWKAFKINFKDFENNEAWLTIPIEGKKDANYQSKSSEKTEYYVYHDQSSTLAEENVAVDFPSHTFYDDFYIDYEAQARAYGPLVSC